MNNSKIKIHIIVFAIILWMAFITTEVDAQLQTARIFTNGMVLQRDMHIPVWGTAIAGDTVVVTLNGEADTVITNVQGKWQADLPAMSAGGPHSMTISNNTQTLTRTQVYIGDVWLASGQSNMAMKLSQSDSGAAEIAVVNNQTIRQFFVQTTLGNDTTEDVPSGSAWSPAISSTVGNFTAVGYYFARDLQRDISVPVGIINSSLGGARIETFMSKEMLGYDEQEVTLANGEPERQPTVAFNTMIHPLIRVPVKGIIWYQAESNGDNMNDAISYGPLFKKLIVSYRNLWGLGDFPFIWVQLPIQGTAAIESQPNAWDAWPQLRANQSKALSLPNTGEATTIDVGAVDIHPTNKRDVGYRLSLVARKVAYAEDIIYSGPRYKSHASIGGGQIKIAFDHIGGGLVAKNSIGDSIHWFSMAGSDSILHSAKAVISNDSVIVSCSQVPSPLIVRYAWEYNPVNVNFYNDANLPAVPFIFNVVDPAFGINSFTTSATTIERWKSAVLSWKVYRASSVTLNGELVDSIDGMSMRPTDTTKYILRAVNRNDTTKIVSDSITINVIEPRPTISIKSDLGDIVVPDTTVTFTADVKTPSGGSIVKVDFYIDGVLLSTDSTAPYQAKLTTSALGVFAINAIVKDGNGAEVESNIISLEVTNLTVIIFEAEKAVRTGTGNTVKNSALTSGGKYVDLQDAWTLTFNGIIVPKTKTYQLIIRYLLNYESPKTQNLLINGALFTSIVFTAPNTSTWMTYRLDVPLDSGDNVIEIQGSWNWMSFDYIALSGPGLVGIKSVKTDNYSGFSLLQNSPNPFSSSTNIVYNLPKSGHVLLDVYDITGKKIAQLVNENLTTGNHSAQFNAGKLSGGVYFVRLTFNSISLTKRMIIIRKD